MPQGDIGMPIKINCVFNDRGAWCLHRAIKRSLFGLGARCCVNYPYLTGCKHQKPHLRPKCPPPAPQKWSDSGWNPDKDLVKRLYRKFIDRTFDSLTRDEGIDLILHQNQLILDLRRNLNAANLACATCEGPDVDVPAGPIS